MAMAQLRSMAELREMYAASELSAIYPTPAATAMMAAEAAANTAAGAVKKAMGGVAKKGNVMASHAAREAAYELRKALSAFREETCVDPLVSATYQSTLSTYKAAYEAACRGAYEAACRGAYEAAYRGAYKVAATAAAEEEDLEIKAEEEAEAALGIKAEEEAEAALGIKASKAEAAFKLKPSKAEAAFKLKPSKAEAAIKLMLHQASKSNVEVASAGGSGCKVPAALGSKVPAVLGSKAPLLQRVDDDYIISLMLQKVARPRHLFASWGPRRSTDPEVMLAYEKARAAINDNYSREDDLIRQYLQDGAAYVAVSSE